MARRDWFSFLKKSRSGRKRRRSGDWRDYERPKKKKSRRSRDRSASEIVMEALQGLNFAVASDDAASAEAMGRFSRIAIIVAAGIALAVVVSLLWFGVSLGVRMWRAQRATPLAQAVVESDIPQLRVRIDRGADVNASGPDGRTPLEIAASSNKIEAARVLLENGAEPTDHACRVAMSYGHTEMLQVLVANGANPDVRDTWHHKSALEWAVERSDVELARSLLEAGANPDSADPLTMPALHLAASKGDAEMVRLLLERGADPALSWNRQVPAETAEIAGHEKLAQMLRDLEASGR